MLMEENRMNAGAIPTFPQKSQQLLVTFPICISNSTTENDLYIQC